MKRSSNAFATRSLLGAVLFAGSLVGELLLSPVATAGDRSMIPDTRVYASDEKAWATLPFTAWEWARQTKLPYRRIPCKDGSSISVQEAYDLYLKVGQPDYPDMDTPGLVTPEEVDEQVKLSARLFKPIPQ